MNSIKTWDLLGKKCKDIVTGFEGVCTGAVEWMYGCKQYKLLPKSEKNARPEIYYYFEKQLEIVDDGITRNIEIPPYEEPVLFGKECRDKVTGLRGMCIGRMVSLFNCTQYSLEFLAKEKDNEPQLVWFDEGRIEVVEDSDNQIDPSDVQSSTPGGMFNSNYYPNPHISSIY